MLIPDNIHPQQSIYYNGAFVLKELQKNKIQNIVDLFENVIKHQKMTFSVFTLCLDWLFILNLINLNNKGEIECI